MTEVRMIGATVPGEPTYVFKIPAWQRLAIVLGGRVYELPQIDEPYPPVLAGDRRPLLLYGMPTSWRRNPYGVDWIDLWPYPDGHYPLGLVPRIKMGFSAGPLMWRVGGLKLVGGWYGSRGS